MDTLQQPGSRRPRGRAPALRVALRSVQMLEAGALGLLVFLRELARQRSLRRPAALRAAGRALVRACTRLGATFIKLGQIASTRADLLPRELTTELASLQDRVPPFPFETVRRTLERDLGRPLESLFDAFEPVPVAAASVAQVHRARLHASGETVAVKVRRPDILDKVRLDRSILLFLARVAERVAPTLRLIALEEAVGHFCAAVEAQIHLDNEARHNVRFRRNFAEDPDIRFPRLVPKLCCDSVLTMEFVDGVPEAELEARGMDVHALVETGLRGVCRMIFLHGFVHADLHPGNLRFVSPASIYALDLGLVGELDDEDRLTTAHMLHAFATGDGHSVARSFYDNSPHAAVDDYAAYEAEIVELVESVRRRGLAQLQITAEIGRIFDILRRYRIQARAHMTMVNLALMTAEGLSKRLAPDLSITQAALPYLVEALATGGGAKAQSATSTPRQKAT